MRKRTVILISTFVFLSVAAHAGVFKPGSPSRVSGQTLTIRWETSDEAGTQKFQLYRREFRSGGMGPAELVAEIEARGQGNSIYQVEDAGMFKTADRVLEYEVRAVDQAGTVLEAVKVTTVFSTGLTSAARRTWGSIKAMFR